MLGFALLLAAAQPDPKTVNGGTLGKAKDFTTPGPARICMNELMVTALPTESVTLGYAGGEIGSLRLNRGRSWVDITMGDTFVGPREVGEIVVRRSTYYIADASSDTKLRYGLFGTMDYYKGYHFRGWIDGPSLIGDKRDDGLLRRIEVRDSDSPPCDVTYHYGWDVVLGDKPLIVRRKQ